MTNFATAFHAECVDVGGTTKIRCSLSFNNNYDMYKGAADAVEQAGIKIVERHFGIGFAFDVAAHDMKEARGTIKALELQITDKQASVLMPNGYKDVCCSPDEAIRNVYQNILTPV